MAAPDDRQGRTTGPSPARNPLRGTNAPWLPMPQAPANDNERAVSSIVRDFFARHVNWLIPTLLLAGFSLALLVLR